MQTVLRQIRNGNITQADADTEFTIINKEQADWKQELERLMSVGTETNSRIERFITQLNALHKKFNYGFYPITPEQKKDSINLLLEKFILYKDGRIELRFKLPVTKTQVAEKIWESSSDVLMF